MADKIRPKVFLDEKILNEINKFYGSRFKEELLGRSCFSYPDVESHICNIKAPLDGGGDCTYCKHRVGRRCHVTCHISHFCLGVYAYRLGIGGDNIEKALKHNLGKLSFNKLYESIFEVLDGSDEDNVKEEVSEAQDLSKVQDDSFKKEESEEQVKGEFKEVENNSKFISDPKKKTVKKVEVETEVEETDADDYITINDAAVLFGCTYVNMYSHVKRGNLKKYSKKGTAVVKKSDVLELKSRKGSRRKRSKKDTSPVESSKAVVESQREEVTEESVEEKDIDASTEQFITINEASNLFGCTYPNMYSHVKRGNLEEHLVEGKRLVKKSEVLALKEKKGRKNSVKE